MAIYNLNGKNARSFYVGKFTWHIDYIGCEDCRVCGGKNQEQNDGRVFPEAHTHGLDQFDHSEIQIRCVPFEISANILNTIAAWIAAGQGRLSKGDKVIIGQIEHTIVAGKDSGDLPVLRLAWFIDPD